MHRHLRPGSGSELLDLRDYLPGDPPKTIAWKVSARRDRLITKEFESDVPLRCTFFVDTSSSVRVGPPGQTALSHVVELSAAAAQAAAGARDLVGLCVFSEQGVSCYARPARGTRHIVGLLNHLAEAAGSPPATGQPRLPVLLPLAYAFAQEVYPYCLHPDVNRVPSWMPFVWSSGPERSGSLLARLFRWVFIANAFLPVVLVVLFFVVFGDLLIIPIQALIPLSETWLKIIGWGLAAGISVLYYPIVNQAFRLLGRAMFTAPGRRRQVRWRKQLACLLAERYNLGPGGIGALLEGDEPFQFYLQRFLAEHHVPYPLPLYDPQGRYLFAAPGKVEVLARALLRAVGKGRDNELFVLLVDLLELSEHLDPLLRAVKVTLARHHQVVMICPWPKGVPPPGKPGATPRQGWALAETNLRQAVHQVTTDRLHRAFAKLRQAFARLGVPVVCAGAGDPVRLILDRLDRLRSLGMGRRR
jgi:uncharacterized protein (DUF58 family)